METRSSRRRSQGHVRRHCSEGSCSNLERSVQILVAAGIGNGGRGGTAPTSASSGATPLMDLLLQYGADVNAQVTGTKTYSMRIARSPATNEGMTALHAAAQAGRTDLVRYLLEKGANPEITDTNGHNAAEIRALLEKAAAKSRSTAVVCDLQERLRLLTDFVTYIRPHGPETGAPTAVYSPCPGSRVPSSLAMGRLAACR
jgi:hypothetical protein